MADIKIGKVTHYFSKIGVAVLELQDSIKIGDRIALLSKKGERFEQIVESMQIEKTQINEAKAGQSVGIKVIQEPKKNSDVFKVS
ncbi:MAG: translation elongation factor-like protein [Candidatus Aenigmatarchaeota archaeon]|nr:translation elongation factor-like protein [Candidatus Aenigmarchaeota archaeon]